MSFDDMKAILNDFGLWEKVSPCYEPDGSISVLEPGMGRVESLDGING